MEELDAFEELPLPSQPVDAIVPKLSLEFGRFIAYYLDADGQNVLTPTKLQLILEFEEKIAEISGYDEYCLHTYVPFNGTSTLVDAGCSIPASLLQLPPYMGLNLTGLVDGNGKVLTGAAFDAGLAQFTAAQVAPATSFWFERDFSAQAPQSFITKSIFTHGAPLEGYGNPFDPEDELEQRKEMEEWQVEFLRVMRSFLEDHGDELEILAIGDGVTNYQIGEYIIRDLSLFGGSIAVVLMLLITQLQSTILGVSALMHIMTAFPVSFFFYKMVFGFQIMTQFNTLALFVVLAIGADDVFVFMDAWKQAGLLGPIVNANLNTRMAFAFRRAATAMFVTSFTTFFAFLATAISPIPPIRALGIFTAGSVAANYLLCISVFAAVVVLHHKSGSHLTGVCCCSGDAATTKTAFKAELTAPLSPAPTPPMSEYRVVERFFHNVFSPWIAKYALVCGVVLGGGAIYLGYQAATGLEVEEEQGFAFQDDFFLLRILDFEEEVFPDSDVFSVPTVHLVWGVAGIDRSIQVDPNDEDTKGIVLYDDGFDPSSEESQEAMVQVCLDGALNTEFALNGAVKCPMLSFMNYRLNNSLAWPAPQDEFFSNFTGWLADDGPFGGGQDPILAPFGDFSAMVSIDDENDRVQFMYATWNMTLGVSPRHSEKTKAFEYWEDLTVAYNKEAPDGSNQAFQVSGVWQWFFMSNLLVQGTWQGLAASMVLAFIVLLLSTTNAIIAALAILTISAILSSVLGVIVLLGWQLGLNETVPIVVMVGLAVDYTVHYSNSFNEAPFGSRASRLRYALTELGISVFGGAVTTLGTTLFLFPANFVITQRFGIIIFINTSFAFIYSTFLFTSLLAVFGPTRTQGELSFLPRSRSKTAARVAAFEAELKAKNLAIWRDQLIPDDDPRLEADSSVEAGDDPAKTKAETVGDVEPAVEPAVEPTVQVAGEHTKADLDESTDT